MAYMDTRWAAFRVGALSWGVFGDKERERSYDVDGVVSNLMVALKLNIQKCYKSRLCRIKV